MEIQFITDQQGKRTAAIIPFDEWERTEKAKDILEHVYLAGIIEERKDSESTINLDDLLGAEGLTRADLEGWTDPGKQVLKQLVKLELDPKYGNPLGNKAGINLEGYFKLYADKKRIRIIYKEMENIIRVIAIDKREDLEVYQIALKRILSMKPE
jgi:mRNA interferase RelE/StbE